jgi:hypothetical protein
MDTTTVSNAANRSIPQAEGGSAQALVRLLHWLLSGRDLFFGKLQQ